jgi:hypothetical protein
MAKSRASTATSRTADRRRKPFDLVAEIGSKIALANAAIERIEARMELEDGPVIDAQTQAIQDYIDGLTAEALSLPAQSLEAVMVQVALIGMHFDFKADAPEIDKTHSAQINRRCKQAIRSIVNFLEKETGIKRVDIGIDAYVGDRKDLDETLRELAEVETTLRSFAL